MTVPHGEQPLTRRELRELERQKPLAQQSAEAKAAEEAAARRRVDQLAAGTSGDAAVKTRGTHAIPIIVSAVLDAPPPQADAPSHDEGDDDAAPALVPILSRRARRALSSDHPLAGADQTGENPVASTSAAPETGPIVAELVSGDTAEHSTVSPTPEVQDVEDAESVDDAAEKPMIEELMVVDEAHTVDHTVEDDEDFAEIDDTEAPGEVHVITIDEHQSSPILAPIFQTPLAAAAEAAVSEEASELGSFDDLLASRGIGSSNSVASTSALVLPSVPNHGDVGTALDETGEVIITGSIDLPMSLGSTGAAPADGLESAELDAFLDPESEVGSDVAPVSATRAVSTHGTSSGLVAPPKRGGANVPVILAITAGALAIGVVGLLLATFLFRLF